MKLNTMNMRLPPPPMQHAFRSISECRVRASFQIFNGGKLLINKYTTHHCSTEYYIELINSIPCAVTYVNNKRVDIREICDESDA
jgi:hypothetical protein